MSVNPQRFQRKLQDKHIWSVEEKTSPPIIHFQIDKGITAASSFLCCMEGGWETNMNDSYFLFVNINWRFWSFNGSHIGLQSPKAFREFNFGMEQHANENQRADLANSKGKRQESQMDWLDMACVVTQLDKMTSLEGRRAYTVNNINNFSDSPQENIWCNYRIYELLVI